MTRQIFPELPYEPARLTDMLLADGGRLLLIGESGAGKSTLTAKLAQVCAERGLPCHCLSADPGSPAFGAPGAVNLAGWRDGAWQAVDLEAVCSLDAARFRLPLLVAVRRLLARVPAGLLLIDTPGLVRGVPALELVEGLLSEVGDARVLVLREPGEPFPLTDMLRTLAGRVCWVASPEQAFDAGRRIRADRRTALWDAYLQGGVTQTLRLWRLPLLGTPPPQSDPDAWRGRQVALLRDGRTAALGEVQDLTAGTLTLRLPASAERPDALVVRDAMRVDDRLVTAKPATPPVAAQAAEPVQRAASRRLGDFEINLVNGVFGDPLLSVRLRRQRRILLFDLGDTSALPAGALHLVSDVFITHAHVDHIGGFLWLLRNRMGDLPPCRLYGPPGLAAHVAGFLNGVLWDRIGDRGPQFEVAELHADRIQRFRLQAGQLMQPLAAQSAAQGVLRQEPEFLVRATALDHGFGTISLAYALETPRRFSVRKERLTTLGLTPGAWLGALKQRALTGALQGALETPDGCRWDSGALAQEILFESAGVKLAYATDLAGSPSNRERLVALAQRADLFYCEASFLEEERDQAERTGHLTTRACTEIAAAANVRELVPFHFSRRYQERLDEVYAELARLDSADDLQADHADDDQAKEGHAR